MSKNGIDISHHDGDINLAKVAYDFCIMKASEGTSFVDDHFVKYYDAVKKRGKITGLYHFANGKSSGKEEADHFLKVIGNRAKEADILVLDWEAGAVKKGVSYAKAFLNRVKEKTGRNAYVYMSASTTREYNWASVAKDHPLWVAQYANNNQTGYQKDPWKDTKGLGAWKKEAIRQYTENGKLAGFSGALDLNIMYDEPKKTTTKKKKKEYNPAAVIKRAAGEVGYLEKKSNSQLDSKTANAGFNNWTKYGRDMHKIYPSIMNFPAPWCDCFIDWLFYKTYGVATAKKLLRGDFDDYTVASANMYKKHNAWHSTPKPGDQIFFRNSERICHTGLVEKVSGGKVYTIEGNTSSNAGVVPNGGGVFRKSYDLGNSRIAGYGRPAYTTTAKKGNPYSEPTKDVTSEKVANANGYKSGYITRGEGVKWVQWELTHSKVDAAKEAVNDAGGVDGICGDGTVKGIKAYQRAKKLEVDGVCGKATRSKMKKD